MSLLIANVPRKFRDTSWRIMAGQFYKYGSDNYYNRERERENVVLGVVKKLFLKIT